MLGDSLQRRASVVAPCLRKEPTSLTSSTENGLDFLATTVMQTVASQLEAEVQGEQM